MPQCKVGFLERPERIVLIIIGALFNRMAPVLWIIAVFSNITVIHRIIYTWRETRAMDIAEAREAEKARATGASADDEASGAEPASGDLHEGYGSSAV